MAARLETNDCLVCAFVLLVKNVSLPNKKNINADKQFPATPCLVLCESERIQEGFLSWTSFYLLLQHGETKSYKPMSLEIMLQQAGRISA